MGNASWSSEVYASTSASYRSMDRSELFNQRKIREDFDPLKITVRESCDSEANPLSNAIIVGLDVTGSMGFIAEHIAKNGLGKLVEGILDTKPVTDPHIMMMAIGDVFCDQAPLQVTQFEADIRIAEQLTNLWLEGGGGGNSFESYDLPWAFAAYKTKIDCYRKRGKKGYLFTIGDEMPPSSPNKRQLTETIGDVVQADPTENQLLYDASDMYNVFHIIVEEGSFASRRLNTVVDGWTTLLGKKAIRLNNYKYISEVILAVIEVNEGRDPEEVIASQQDPGARAAVEHALFPSNQ